LAFNKKTSEEEEAMKKLALVLALVAAVFMVGPQAALAASPIQIALFNPIQIINENNSIAGLRLNFIYGVNQDVTGLDLGLINQVHGDFKGIQFGLASIVGGDATGWQDSWINIVEGTQKGLQWGIYNQSNATVGWQWGLINKSYDARGLQLGLVNWAEKLHGLQIGIANINNTPNPFRFFPIVNWSF
jgi:hypothetical protein